MLGATFPVHHGGLSSSPFLCVFPASGAEGKGGMAAIADPSHTCDLEKFGKDMEKVLPPYARPVFLRLLAQVDKTGKYSFLFCLIVFLRKSKPRICCMCVN